MVGRPESPDVAPAPPPVARRSSGAAGTASWPSATVAVAAILFLAAFANALRVFSIGWGNGIFDSYGFRQTQTAMSVRYMLQGGPLLAYETPLFGYPWATPIEFPLYQWIVAALVWLSGMPLEQAGRCVSAAFFLASLVPAWLLLRSLRLSLPSCLLCLAILLASPFYLFWSRTFMIESTALFLSLSYLAAVLSWRRRPTVTFLLLAAALGSLAALVKLTTFAAFMAAAGALLTIDVLRARPWRRLARLWQYALAGAAFAVVPYVVSAVWVAFCDRVKEQNFLLVGFLTSDGLYPWVFGNWAQRVSPDTWGTLWARHPDWVGHWMVFAIGGVALVLARGRRAAPLAALALGLGVLFVFTNLHALHHYYQYSNVVFLLAAIGLGLGALVDAGGWRRVAGLLFGLVVIAVMIRAYGYRYLALQSTDRRPHDEFATHVRTVAGPQDVVAIWGCDWSPELPYAAERRALMWIPYFDRRDPQPVITRALEALHAHSYEVTALVFCNASRDEAFVAARLALFPDFGRVYRGDNNCDLYTRS